MSVAHFEKALKVAELIKKAHAKREVIEHSPYYVVFGRPGEKTKDLLINLKVQYRLQNYYLNLLERV